MRECSAGAEPGNGTAERARITPRWMGEFPFPFPHAVEQLGTGTGTGRRSAVDEAKATVDFDDVPAGG